MLTEKINIFHNILWSLDMFTYMQDQIHYQLVGYTNFHEASMNYDAMKHFWAVLSCSTSVHLQYSHLQ